MPNGADTLQFTDGITADRVSFAREASEDLTIRVTDSTDSLTVTDWYADPAARIERIVFSDGAEFDTSALDALTVAPISLSEPGALTGTPYRDTLIGSAASGMTGEINTAHIPAAWLDLALSGSVDLALDFNDLDAEGRPRVIGITPRLGGGIGAVSDASYGNPFERRAA